MCSESCKPWILFEVITWISNLGYLEQDGPWWSLGKLLLAQEGTFLTFSAPQGTSGWSKEKEDAAFGFSEIIGRRIRMKKIIVLLLLILVGGVVFAGGTVDMSTVSSEDVKAMRVIAADTEPVVALKRALELFPNALYPLYEYEQSFKLRINRIFNKYGVTFSVYDTYTGEYAELLNQVKFNMLYISNVDLNKKEALLSQLQLLE